MGRNPNQKGGRGGESKINNKTNLWKINPQTSEIPTWTQG